MVRCLRYVFLETEARNEALDSVVHSDDVSGIRAVGCHWCSCDTNLERQAVEQSKSRHAQTALKTSSESQRWLESQADFLSGWMTLFPDLSKRSPAEQVGFLRAVYRAMPAVASATLMTPEGRLWTDNSGTVVPPQFLQEGLRTGENRRGRTEKELERALQGFPKIAPSMTQYGSFYQDESGLTTTLWTRGTLDNDIVLMVELNLDPVAQWFVSDAEQYSSVLMDNQGAF